MFFDAQKLCQKLISYCFLAAFSSTVFAAPGLFWKAESPTNNTIYLFGTIHTDDNRVTDFSPALIASLKSVDAFMMEVDAPKDASVLMMSDANLQTILTQSELDKVDALAEFHVMPRDAALRTKPWLLAVVFDAARPITPFAQDNLLMRLAEDFGKEVISIETAAEHFSVMDNLSIDEQLIFLRAVLKRSAQAKERDYERLIQTYLTGDSEKLTALNSKMMAKMLPASLWARMRRQLLDERNAVMAARVLDAAKNKSLFVAVGASHLAGKNGLIASLKQAGYQLTIVK
ncbi:MAG: TraB/GumN family protein [Methylotenera sp.]|nr:TraB/GumN family protein [Methylotenera sp.]MDP1958129.1 TraB/GumN family protein [Methylotenera sp.]MDP3206907.1 TraB/GumN family protein [Methylotenera sp.]MDP3303067.1 TraB/GumN family protein [Methylotenera sp.]MDP3943409.1 TraB/GumN family protein [Methylotenera sp.]